MEKKDLNKLVKALKLIDTIPLYTSDIKDIAKVRGSILSIIFSYGYKIEYKTYKLIKL